MKYIGAGLFAIAAAYLEVSGNGGSAVVFLTLGMLIAILGSDKTQVTVNNIFKDAE